MAIAECFCLWSKSNRVKTKAMISNLMNFVGGSLSFVLPPLFVDDNPTDFVASCFSSSHFQQISWTLNMTQPGQNFLSKWENWVCTWGNEQADLIIAQLSVSLGDTWRTSVWDDGRDMGRHLPSRKTTPSIPIELMDDFTFNIFTKLNRIHRNSMDDFPFNMATSLRLGIRGWSPLR